MERTNKNTTKRSSRLHPLYATTVGPEKNISTAPLISQQLSVFLANGHDLLQVVHDQGVVDRP
jgi:hypothetical protein